MSDKIDEKNRGNESHQKERDRTSRDSPNFSEGIERVLKVTDRVPPPKNKNER